MNTDQLVAWVLRAYTRATSTLRGEEGASLVEYALLVGLIAVVCIGAVTFLGNNSASKFSSIGSSIQ